MTKTPICDFIRKYAALKSTRFHMPGHKGIDFTGIEKYDITEIDGADVLYSSDGIIRESETVASELFGTKRTVYSAEGSSLCIRAMLYMTKIYAELSGRKPIIAAGRNAHKTFITAAALNDLEIEWIFAEDSDGIISCKISAGYLDKFLSKMEEKPVAVYVTSPDYLGNITDIKGISEICKKHGTLLLVDNAHGAYLRFMDEDIHPITLGADMCCDSAHKTLPVLTGGAYLHIGKNAPEVFSKRAEDAMSVFASTSPSYLILQSLDTANRYMSDGYKKELKEFGKRANKLKSELSKHGYRIIGDEALKLTIAPKSYGYTGNEIAHILKNNNMICEFSDPDYVVIMMTPQISNDETDKLKDVLTSIPKRPKITELAPTLPKPEKQMSPKEALFSAHSKLPVHLCNGRILASPTVSCPPAIPVVVCGELISSEAVRCFEYYKIDSCNVIDE